MGLYSDDCTLALELADLADATTLPRFQAHDLVVNSKPDLTPVSDADTACEQALRARLQKARPGDSILGEEYGGQPVLKGRQWVIDPIDGTKNFVRGVPVWASLISLLVDGTPVLGVVSAPALGRRWWAAQGDGAWSSFGSEAPRRLSVSQVSNIADASLSFSSLSGWKDVGLLENFVELSLDTWRLRGYGDFYSYCLLAEGAVDIAAEPELNLWDMAAPCALVQEAGGRFSSLDGTDGPHGANAVASNGLLHAEVLTRIGTQRV